MEQRKIKANWLPMEKDQFSQILIDIVDEILAEPEELMLKFAKNKDQMQDLLKDCSDDDNTNQRLDSLRISNDFKDSLSYLEINDLLSFGLRNQSFSKEIIYPKVLLQTSMCLCGFHAFFNAKCTILSLIAKDTKTKIFNQLKCNLKSFFWSNYLSTRDDILNNCKRLLDQDKVYLMKEGPLERYMLKYLIFNDKEYLSIKENNQDIIFETHPIYFAFGFVQNDRNEVAKISQSIQRLHRTKKPFILTLFLGVVNHWTTLTPNYTI